MPEVPRTHSVPATARILGISPASVYKGVHAGEVEAIRIGGRLLVLSEPLERKLRGLPAREIEVQAGAR